MLTSKAIFLWISHQKKNMWYLHIILWKKMFCAKKVTKLPDLTVPIYILGSKEYRIVVHDRLLLVVHDRLLLVYYPLLVSTTRPLWIQSKLAPLWHTDSNTPTSAFLRTPASISWYTRTEPYNDNWWVPFGWLSFAFATRKIRFFWGIDPTVV